MKEWVLIIQLLSPAGDYMDKIPVTLPSQAACFQAARQLPKRGENSWGLQFKGVCVTMAHWTGKHKDPGVNYD